MRVVDDDHQRRGGREVGAQAVQTVVARPSRVLTGRRDRSVPDANRSCRRDRQAAQLLGGKRRPKQLRDDAEGVIALEFASPTAEDPRSGRRRSGRQHIEEDRLTDPRRALDQDQPTALLAQARHERCECQGAIAAIVRVDRARQLAKPRVTAKLTRLRGGKLKLAWNARAIPGQRLRLLDRAPGTTTVVQRLTARHRGSVTFRPAATLARGKHTIEADVFENGRPRAQLTVLRYKLTSPVRPGAVTHPVAKRTSSGLSITWAKAPRATDYLVTVTSGTQTIAATDTRRTSLLIPSAPLGALTVR